MTQTHPTKPRSKLWLYGPFVLFGLLVAAYCAYWFYVRGELETGVETWIADQRAAGADISYSDKRLGGFPYRFALIVDDPSYTDPAGATDWQGERLEIFMQPWNFKHAIIRSAGRNELAQANGANLTALIGKKSALSLKWDENGLTDYGLTLDTLDLVTAQGDVGVQGLTANFMLASEASPLGRLSVDWDKVQLDPAFLQGTDLAFLGTELQTARLRLEGQGFGLFGDGPVRKLEIAQFLLNWGPMHLGAKGKFDIGAQGYPDGTLQVRLEDGTRFTRLLQDEGLLTSETALVFGPLVAASRDNGFFPIPLRNGQITMLGQSMGSVPRIAAPRPGES